jgi:hypothetical protein
MEVPIGLLDFITGKVWSQTLSFFESGADALESFVC